VRIDFGVAGMAWREVGTQRTLLARNPKDPGMIATRLVIQRTLEAFRTGGEPPASARVGREVMEVIAACYLAAARGERVVVGGNGATAAYAMQMGAAPSATRPASAST
jgi:predicted dehydrogenase